MPDLFACVALVFSSLTTSAHHCGRHHTVPSSACSAQAVYGSIGGVVTDASGAVVPGATVTITSVERKTIDVVTSNESGYYLKERLLPGTYEVKAELQGFKTARLSTT